MWTWTPFTQRSSSGIIRSIGEARHCRFGSEAGKRPGNCCNLLLRSAKVRSAFGAANIPGLEIVSTGYLPAAEMGKYERVSGRVMTIFLEFTDMIEQVSIDEAFLDVTGSEKLFGTGPEIAER